MKRDCRKKPIKTTISCSGDAGFLRIHIIHLLVNLSGHKCLIFRVNLLSLALAFTVYPAAGDSR